MINICILINKMLFLIALIMRLKRDSHNHEDQCVKIFIKKDLNSYQFFCVDYLFEKVNKSHNYFNFF